MKLYREEGRILMDKKRLIEILLLCGIFLWIIPSATFQNIDKKIVLFYFSFHIIISLLYVTQLRNVNKDKTDSKFEWILIYLSIVGCMIVHVVTIVILLIQGLESNFKVVWWILIARLLIVCAFIIFRYSGYEESPLDKKIREEKLMKSKTDNKKTKKKINNKWMLKILLEDLKSNMKNYIVFIVSAVLTFTYVYGFLGNLLIVHSIQDTDIIEIWSGITLVVVNALFIISIVTILIQFYALKNYIQNRMYDLKTLLLLGMKKKEIFKGLGVILLITLLASYLIGVVLGNIMIFIFKKIYGYYLPNTVIPELNIMLVTVLSFILCILILCFILAIIQDMVIESRMLDVSNSDSEEKMIKPRKIIFILPIFLIILFRFYYNPHWAESLYIIYPWLIVFVMFIYFGAGYILRKLQRKDRYNINNILTLNLIYYKSRSYTKNSLILFVLLFVMFFTYAFQISTLFPLESKELYPYEYVCLGYEEDKKAFEDIQNKFDVDSKIYPVVRVTVPGGEDGGYGNLYKSLPIGHHLGISESTYKSLTGKELNLEEKEVSILYQEDKSNKAHPLDFYADRTKPMMRVGQAEHYDFRARRIFFNLDYNLREEKREIVLGRLSDVMYENLVVFSDEYFNVQYKNAKGIKYIMTINSKKTNDEKLDIYLQNYKKTHNQESEFDNGVSSVYKAKDLNDAFQGDKIFELIINVSILITFTIAAIIIVFVHAFGNISYYKERYELLSYLGEKQKNSKSIIKKEIWLFAILPCILAILTSLIFVGITVTIRGFNYIEIITSGKVYLGIILGFLFIYGVSIFIISHFLTKEIGGK